MNTLLHLDTFWAPDTRNALVKSPMEYTLGLVQRFQLTALNAASLRLGVTFLNNMGVSVRAAGRRRLPQIGVGRHQPVHAQHRQLYFVRRGDYDRESTHPRPGCIDRRISSWIFWPHRWGR